MILRVFPERTYMTPKDDMVAIGDPGFFRPEGVTEVHVSCAFSWDRTAAERLADAWRQYYRVVKLGGPAIAPPEGPFIPGRYVKRGITFTSRGCNKQCIARGTLVSTERGPIPIESIKPGDHVQGFDLSENWEREQTVRAVIVAGTRRDIMAIQANGHSIRCTSDHPFWTRRGWIEAQHLTLRDEVLVDLQSPQEWHDPIRVLQGTPRASSENDPVSRSFSEERQGQEDVGPTGKTLMCYGGASPQEPHNGSGAVCSILPDEAEQPDEEARDQREASPSIPREKSATGGSSQKIACRGYIRTSSSYDREAKRCTQEKDEGKQPDAFIRSTPKSIAGYQETIRTRSAFNGGALGERRGVSEQGGTPIVEPDCPAGLSLYRRWSVLDRPLPKWALPQSGFCIWARRSEGSHTAERGILAQPSKERRRDGNEGLFGDGVEGLDHQGYRVGSASSAHDHRMASWCPVTSVIPARCEEVFDIEAYPDHNFFANGILVHNCPWCLVPQTEGKLRTLPDIAPGNVVQDNNLLMCGREHMTRVFDMLKQQPYAARFTGGIDADLVDDWFAEQVRGLRIEELWLAADYPEALKKVGAAVEKLSFLKGKSKKLRCYVLAGFQKNETVKSIEDRCWYLFHHGLTPFLQLYQPPDEHIDYPQEWRDLAWKWSRPAVAVSRARRRGEIPPEQEEKEKRPPKPRKPRTKHVRVPADPVFDR